MSSSGVSMRLLLVDDEALARERTRRLVEKAGGASIVGEARNGEEAMAMIESCQPDVLLCDIQMPKLDGLRLMESLDDPPVVIFATAHAEHAVKAFDLEAADYLLKPFSAERLRKALDRARRKLGGSADDGPGVAPARIAVEAGQKTELLAPGQIALVRLVENVVFVWATNGEEYLCAGALSDIEEKLPPAQFARVNRRAVVNLAEVRKYEPTEEGGLLLTLSTGQCEVVSRRRARLVRERLG